MRLTRPAVTLWIASALVAVGLLAMPLLAFAATQPVTIQGFAFKPPTVTVHVGDTVTWTNGDVAAHTSTSDTGLWSTPALAQGDAGSFTFTVPGTFGYHCMIHTSMKGTVVVLAATTSPPTPPPTLPPTPVPTARTPVPTVAPTVAATPVPTAEPSVSASSTPAGSPSPSASATATASAVAVALPSATSAATEAVPSDAAPGPVLVGGAIVAVAGLAALAFVIARRR